MSRKATKDLIESKQIVNATYANGIRVRGARKILTDKVVTLHHMSFDTDNIKMFVPRVPSSKAGAENGTIPRICLSDSIERAIAAIPDGADMIGDTPINDYEIQLSLYEPGLISWQQLYTKGYVPDSEITHEFWYKGNLIVSPNKIVITNWIDTYKYVVTEADKYRIYEELVKVLPKAIYVIPHIKEYAISKVVNELVYSHRYTEIRNALEEVMSNLDIESILYLSNLKYKTVK